MATTDWSTRRHSVQIFFGDNFDSTILFCPDGFYKPSTYIRQFSFVDRLLVASGPTFGRRPPDNGAFFTLLYIYLLTYGILSYT